VVAWAVGVVLVSDGAMQGKHTPTCFRVRKSAAAEVLGAGSEGRIRWRLTQPWPILGWPWLVLGGGSRELCGGRPSAERIRA